jgi:hypothetical protein
MKSASRWFNDTDSLWCTASKPLLFILLTAISTEQEMSPEETLLSLSRNPYYYVKVSTSSVIIVEIDIGLSISTIYNIEWTAMEKKQWILIFFFLSFKCHY